MRYQNSVMTTHFHDGSASQEEPCAVIVQGNTLVVEYKRDNGYSSYRGTQDGDVYKLRFHPETPGFKGEATLSLPEGGFMDGDWSESGAVTSAGTWEIELRE